MSEDFDLWGDPIPPKVEKRGRPVHEVTEQKRLRVAVLRTLRYTNDDIAAAMGISERTLRAKYLPELKGGLQQKRAEMLVRLFEAGAKGNVSAMKAFIRETELADLRNGPVVLQPKPSKSPKLGKKEQAILDASDPDKTSSIGALMSQRAEMTGQGKPH